MKHRLSILSAFLFLVALTACQTKPSATLDPVVYNDSIVDIQTNVVDHFDRFIDAVSNYDSVGALQALELALDTAQAGMAQLTALPAFEGKSDLRDAAKNLVQLYARGLDQDFRAILPVLVSHASTLVDLEHADSVRTAFSEEEDHLFALVVQAQNEFAKAHHFEVVQTP